jgi:hypothetical protein
VLGYMGRLIPAPTGQTDALVRLHYTDGTAAEVPLRAGYEVPGYNGDDARVPQVLYTDHVIGKLNSLTMLVTAPRLQNPHPERVPVCLDFEVVANSGTLSVLAITVEPGDGQAL